MSKLELAFNLFYVDSTHIASFSSARLPLRAPGTDPQLPTVGTGAYDWNGFARPGGAPAGDRPAERLHRQLEQPARAGLRRLGRQLVVRLRPARGPARRRLHDPERS